MKKSLTQMTYCPEKNSELMRWTGMSDFEKLICVHELISKFELFKVLFKSENGFHVAGLGQYITDINENDAGLKEYLLGDREKNAQQWLQNNLRDFAEIFFYQRRGCMTDGSYQNIINGYLECPPGPGGVYLYAHEDPSAQWKIPLQRAAILRVSEKHFIFIDIQRFTRKERLLDFRAYIHLLEFHQYAFLGAGTRFNEQFIRRFLDFADSDPDLGEYVKITKKAVQYSEQKNQLEKWLKGR